MRDSAALVIGGGVAAIGGMMVGHALAANDWAVFVGGVVVWAAGLACVCVISARL